MRLCVSLEECVDSGVGAAIFTVCSGGPKPTKTLRARIRRRVFRRPQIQDRRSKTVDPKAKVANPLEECDDSGFTGPAPRFKFQGLKFDFFASGAPKLTKNLARASAGAKIRRSLGSEI